MTGTDDSRRALGARLRELRAEAPLTGVQFAQLAGWGQPRISKIETGQQLPTDADLTTWCRITNAPDALPDLIATARNIHSAYQEWKRTTATGHTPRQRLGQKLEADTTLIRGYATPIPFALLQTRDYAHAILARCIEFLAGDNDVADAVAARMRRQRILNDPSHHFHLLLDQRALRTRVGDERARKGQLQHLLQVMRLPQRTLGIIPDDSEFVYVTTNFTMFDRHTVQVETISAELTITQPRELTLYEKIWAALHTQAVYGDTARALITAAITSQTP
ncbi:transcriptional regulator with XRE-family HTH domain [Nocardia sp. GAS34]|uniref:helix-turn-helix domain-containing protein n=1 Tax=unclassified Nocardia TaxID=2637762 RepID=UPI003D1B038E